MRLYGPSQNCFRVRSLAAHVEMDLEIVPVSIFEGAAATPEFLAKNPMGTEPLRETDSGEYLPESNAILTRLAEGTAYLPPDRMAHAQVTRWLMFEQRYVQTSISRLRYWTLTDKLDQFSHQVSTARRLGDRSLDILEQELGKRPFIAGEAYIVADTSVFAYAQVAEDAGFSLPQRPNLQRWLARVRQQPRFCGTVIPYSGDPHAKRALPFVARSVASAGF